jgi:hypothetical protein
MNFNIHYESKRFLEKSKISKFPYAEKIYSLLKITKDIAEKANLRVLDENIEDNIILVHYFSQSEYVSNVSHIRGIVINMEGEFPKIIAESFPFTSDFEIKDVKCIESLYDEFIPEDNIITQGFEGTIIRIFKGPKTGKWYISTHKKINGRNSRWSGPSFGDIFDKIWGSYEEYPMDDYFEKHKCYVFIISHPENKLVSDIQNPSIRLLGIFTPPDSINPGILEQSGSKDLNLLKHHPRVLKQDKLSIKNITELFEKTKNSCWKNYSGIIIYHKKNKTCYKFMNSEYFYLKEIRGNEPNFRLRYLELISKDFTDKTNKLQIFKELFPEKEEYFKEVSDDCKLISSYLETLYIKRYKNSDETKLPRESYIILEKTRRNYDPFLTLRDNIEENISIGSSPRQVNAIIKYMRIKNKL